MTSASAPIRSGPPGRQLLGLVISQALGAFNDNAWKQIAVLLTASAAASFEATMRQAALAQATLLLPLVLFNLPGGALADRLSKRTVLVALKVVEVALMAVAGLALIANPAGGNAALLVLGLLGVQAALSSPSKYGILPEILPHESLSVGNGLLEMWGNLAIILGTVAGGLILELSGARTWLGALSLTVVAACGLAAALTIPRVPAARPERRLSETLGIGWTAIRTDRIMRLATVGQILIWSIASLIPAAVLSHSLATLGLPRWQTGFPLAALGLGIGLGSMAAGKLSAAKVEYGLVPLGAIGLFLSTLVFGLITPGFALTMVLMALVGVSGGLVLVPLNALIQWRAPEDRRGSVISVVTVLVNVGMLAGSVLAFLLAATGIGSASLFLGVAIALGLGTV
ncbi:MAG: MFS transporter [Isosphaeraceae bacterium]